MTPKHDDLIGVVVSDNPPEHRRSGGGGAIRARFALFNALVDKAMRDMTRGELVVWLVLYRHADAVGEATAAVADIARRGGCNPGTVKRGLVGLQRAGLVTRIKRGTLAGGPSRWRLNRLLET